MFVQAVGGALLLLVLLWLATKMLSRKTSEDSERPRVRARVETKDEVQGEGTAMAKSNGVVSVVWVCAGCDNEYETEDEANDCCEDCDDAPTQKFKCPECEEVYDTVNEAKNCCGAKADERIQKEEVVEIDGQLKYGHFKCKDKDCSWFGGADDLEEQKTFSIKTEKIGEQITLTGESITGYEGRLKSKKKIRFICPDCQGEVEFVEDSKEEKKTEANP